MNAELHPDEAIAEINKILEKTKGWSISGDLTFTDTSAINTPDDLQFSYTTVNNKLE